MRQCDRCGDTLSADAHAAFIDGKDLCEPCHSEWTKMDDVVRRSNLETLRGLLEAEFAKFMGALPKREGVTVERQTFEQVEKAWGTK